MTSTTPADQPPAKTLAVVRCGDASLHPSWAAVGHGFDVAVSYFGSDAEKSFPEALYVHRFKGGKWEGIHDFFQIHPDLVTSYDYFWFPDDDIRVTPDDVARLIDLGRSYGLGAFQPTLDDKSYLSHVVTLHHPSFKIRYTNFIEVMAPVLRRDVFVKVLPRFEAMRFGFGLDFLFHQIAAEETGKPETCTAMIDLVTVEHTRPVGGALHQMARNDGKPGPIDELVIIMQHVDADSPANIGGVPVPKTLVLSGIDKKDRQVAGLRLSLLLLKDVLLRRRDATQKLTPKAIIKHFLKPLT